MTDMRAPETPESRLCRFCTTPLPDNKFVLIEMTDGNVEATDFCSLDHVVAHAETLDEHV